MKYSSYLMEGTMEEYKSLTAPPHVPFLVKDQGVIMYNNTRYPKDKIMAKLDFIGTEIDEQFPSLIIQCTELYITDHSDLHELIDYFNTYCNSVNVPSGHRGTIYRNLIFSDCDGNLIVQIPVTFPIFSDSPYPSLYAEFNYGYDNKYIIDCDGGSMELSNYN